MVVKQSSLFHRMTQLPSKCPTKIFSHQFKMHIVFSSNLMRTLESLIHKWSIDIMKRYCHHAFLATPSHKAADPISLPPQNHSAIAYNPGKTLRSKTFPVVKPPKDDMIYYTSNHSTIPFSSIPSTSSSLSKPLNIALSPIPCFSRSSFWISSRR